MRLTSALVQRALGQFEAQPIPDDHPAIPQLRGLYGDHTFFLDTKGLNIVEPIEPGEGETQVALVVNLASWNDDDPPSLSPHEPEPTDRVIALGARN